MGIYMIQNTINSKFYIGSSANLRKRCIAHTSLLDRGKHQNVHLQRAWNKNGNSNFQFTVLIHVKHEEELLSAEQDAINTMNPDYNIAIDAGAPTRGLKMSKETCKRLSDMRKGPGSYWYGKKRYPETIKKISDNRLGAPAWNKGIPNQAILGDNNPAKRPEVREKIRQSKAKYKRPVVRIDPINDTKEAYDSIKKAALYNNLNHSHITSCCSGNRKSHGGFHWQYATKHQQQSTKKKQ